MYTLENTLLQPDWSGSPSYFDYYAERLSDVNVIDRGPEMVKISVREGYEVIAVDDSLEALAF